MQFLKILFWCLLAFVAAAFTIGNWTTVAIKLWGGLVAEVNLPLLLFVTFLLGLAPTLLWHQTIRWRLRSRLGAAERAMTDLQGALRATPPAPATPPRVPAPAPVPPIAAMAPAADDPVTAQPGSVP